MVNWLKPLEEALEKLPGGRRTIGIFLFCVALLYLCSLLLSSFKFLQSQDSHVVGWFVAGVFSLVWIAALEYSLARSRERRLPAVLVIASTGLVIWGLFAAWPLMAEADTCGRISLRWPLAAAATCIASLPILLKRPKLSLRFAQISGAVAGGALLFYLTAPVWDRWVHGVRAPQGDKVGIWISRFEHDADGKIQGAILQSLKEALEDQPSGKDVFAVLEVPWLITGPTDREKYERAKEITTTNGVAIFVYGISTIQDTYVRLIINDRIGVFATPPSKELRIKGQPFPSEAIQEVKSIARFLAGTGYLAAGNCALAEQKLSFLVEGHASPLNGKSQVGASSVTPGDVALFRAAAIVCQVDRGEASVDRLSEADAILNEQIDSNSIIQQLDLLSLLGKVYRMKATRSAPEQNLRRAVNIYEQALKAPRPRSPETDLLVSILMSNLGVAYEDLSQHDDRRGNMHKAVLFHTEALAILPSKPPPSVYTVLLNNLGSAHTKLSYVDKGVQNLKLAVEFGERSLNSICPGDSQLFGLVKSNLGDAYLQLAKAQGDQNALSSSISLLEESLSLGKQVLGTRTFAETHFKLGNALVESSKDDVDTPSFRRGVASLACSASTFRGVDSHKEAIATQRLREVGDTAASRYSKGALSDILRLTRIPEGCSYRADEILRGDAIPR